MNRALNSRRVTDGIFFVVLGVVMGSVVTTEVKNV